ncbi:MAG TPA: TerS protein [Rubrivivax sp.]|mgnify:CR=1 FL=1|nr:TerS protein [Rubrivivax sp.]
MTKRNPATGAEAAVKAMLDAAMAPVDVPKHVRLRPEDRPFWQAIIRARARDEWTPPALVVAAQLARCMADIEAESEQLQAEGTVVSNDRGTRLANPRAGVLDLLGRRQLALMRALHMTGSHVGDSRREATRRKLQRQAEQLRGELGDDDLLAV